MGLAWLKQLCNSGSSIQQSISGKSQYVSGAGVSSISKDTTWQNNIILINLGIFFLARDEWKVVAHEVGHGFGNTASSSFIRNILLTLELVPRCHTRLFK